MRSSTLLDCGALGDARSSKKLAWKTLFNLTKVVLGMAADSAPDSPHAALLAAPLLDDLLSLDLELASEDTASGGAGQSRSAAGSPPCI